MTKKFRKPYEYESWASDRGWCHGYACKVFNRVRDRSKLNKAILAACDVNDSREKPQPFLDNNVVKAFRSGFWRAAGTMY